MRQTKIKTFLIIALIIALTVIFLYRKEVNNLNINTKINDDVYNFISRTSENDYHNLYNLNTETGIYEIQELKMGMNEDVFGIVTSYKYPEILFIFSENKLKTNSWSIYSFNTKNKLLKKLHDFKSYAPTFYKVKGEEDVVYIEYGIAVDSDNNIINELSSTFSTKKFGIDYFELHESKFLKLYPNKVVEIQNTGFSYNKVPQDKIIESIKNFGDVNWTTDYITNKDSNTIFYYSIFNHGFDNRFIGKFDGLNNITNKNIKISNEYLIKILNFSKDDRSFFNLSYLKDQLDSIILEERDTNSLNIINSIALHDINFLFNIQSNLSNKSDYLMMAFFKAKKHIDDKITGNKTFLVVYKIKDKTIRTIQIPDYVVLPR